MTGLYNAAASNIAVGEAAQLVAGITGATVVERHHGADPRNYAMDTSRLEAIAGWWRPRPLASSVRDLIDHYREIGLTARDITTQRYHRITQYRARIATVEAGAAK